MQVPHRIVRPTRLIVFRIFLQFLFDDVLHLRLSNRLQLMQSVSQHGRAGPKTAPCPSPTQSLAKKDDRKNTHKAIQPHGQLLVQIHTDLLRR